MQELYKNLTEAFSSMPVPYLLNILDIGTAYYRIDQQLILNEAGLYNLDELKNKERVPLYYGYAFVMSILRHSGDEQAGLVIGKSLQLKSFHVLGYLLMNCKHLGEAIAVILQFEKLSLECSNTTFIQNNEEGRLIWHCPYPGEESRYFVEIILSGWINHALDMTRHNPRIKEVNFMHSPPKNITPYRQAYGDCTINFNASENSVVFPLSSLDIPFKAYDSELKKILSQQARDLLDEFQTSVNFISSVRKNIFLLMQGEQLNLENVADRLGLSSRVLHNRLKKQGLTFNCLVDEVRRIIANMAIGNHDISLVELGYLLGFNDQSSFTRAFKRWHGETPGDFRRQIHVLHKTDRPAPAFRSLNFT